MSDALVGAGTRQADLGQNKDATPYRVNIAWTDFGTIVSTTLHPRSFAIRLIASSVATPDESMKSTAANVTNSVELGSVRDISAATRAITSSRTA